MVVEVLDHARAAGDVLERGVELGQILDFEHDVKLGQDRRPEAQFAPGNAVADHQPLVTEMAKLGVDLMAKRDVAGAGLEVAPDVIDVHGR